MRGKSRPWKLTEQRLCKSEKIRPFRCLCILSHSFLSLFLLLDLHRVTSGLSIGGRRLRKGGCVGSFRAGLCTVTLSLGRVEDRGGLECPSTAVPDATVTRAPYEGPLQPRGSCLTGSLVAEVSGVVGRLSTCCDLKCSVPLFWGAGYVSKETPCCCLFGKIQ